MWAWLVGCWGLCLGVLVVVWARLCVRLCLWWRPRLVLCLCLVLLLVLFLLCFCVRRLLVVGFGARVCDWGARVGVGGGVVSGGGVVARLWAGVVGCVRALVSGVGAWGLVLVGLVGAVGVGGCARVGGVVWVSCSWRVRVCAG